MPFGMDGVHRLTNFLASPPGLRTPSSTHFLPLQWGGGGGVQYPTVALYCMSGLHFRAYLFLVLVVLDVRGYLVGFLLVDGLQQQPAPLGGVSPPVLLPVRIRPYLEPPVVLPAPGVSLRTRACFARAI